MSVKIKRALEQCSIGRNPGAAQAMLDAIPAAVQEKLTSKELAALLDAVWGVAQTSKAIAAREAISDGAIWDADHQIMLSIEAPS